MSIKKKIFELLNSEKHIAISTVNKTGNPEAAIVGFGQNKKLELIFGTDMTTRKALNISSNNNIAAVVNGSDCAIQYEGKAHLLDGQELLEFQEIFFKKMPGLEKYSHLTNQIYFKVVPGWIRFIDHTTSPGTITEVTF